jgi:hypothetical protein
MAILGTPQECLRYIGTGQNCRAVQEGQFAFSTTSATFALDVYGMREVETVQVWPIGATNADTDSINVQLGTLSATGTANIIVGKTGTVTAVRLVVTTTLAAHNDNHWTFTLLNKTAADAAVIASTGANSTDANSSPAGFTLTAYTPQALTLGAGVAITAADNLLFTATKAASASDLVAASLQISYSTLGTDEAVYWSDSLGTTGWYSLTSSNQVTVTRTGVTKTSALKCGYRVVGR